MKTSKEILDKLPSNWDELKLKAFIELTEIQIDDTSEFDGLFTGANNTTKVISVLADVSIEQVESLPLIDISRLAKKIEFLSVLPDTKKSTIEWKNIETVSYGGFVTFELLAREPLKNLPAIIKSFCKNEMTEAQILELSTADAYAGFFLLLTSVKKSVRRMITSSSKILLMQSIKKLTPFKKKCKA